MKKLLLSFLFAVAAFSAFAQTTIGYRVDIATAQSHRGLSLTYDPVVSTQLATFRNSKYNFSFDLVGFTGMRTNNNVPFAGFAIGKRFNLADNLPFFVGFQGTFENKRPISGGLMITFDLAAVKF